MTHTMILECSNGKKLKRNPSACSSSMMGKPQKISKKYYSGKLTDHKHSVDAVEEMERCSSSCRVDSETSCTAKKSFASKNVPMQHISASTMSGKELKDLEMRLRGELEKVRSFQMKTLSRASVPAVANGGSLLSSRDGHAIKSSLKRGLSDKLGSAKPIPTSTTDSTMHVMKQCESILKNLMQHRYCWVFNTPVDVVKLKLPDYYTIIKQPMDLGTVKKKLASSSYSNPSDFASDIRLTFANAMKYNPPGNDVHIMADTLRKMFEKRWKPIEDKLVETDNIIEKERELIRATKAEPVLSSKKRKSPLVSTEAEPVLSSKKIKSTPMPTKAESVLSSKKRKSPPMSTEAEPVLSSKKRIPPPMSTKAESVFSSKKRISPPISPKAESVLSPKKRISPPKKNLTTMPKIEKQKMSLTEKYKLSDRIQSFQQDLPDHIVDFLRQQTMNGKSSDDEIEIDIDSLDDDTLFKLQKLMDDYFGIKNPKEDIKNCEMEVLVESGVSNLSVPRQVNGAAVNEPADEEIDIGGDETDVPPIVSYPPLEIEEDIAPKCSSSSSSSSDSGSSSDDSDSDSSSESDSDALAPTISGKENGNPDISRSLDKFNSTTSADPARTISGMGQDESTDNVEPLSSKTEECRDGNNVSKKQLSPDKRYRAALLKSRFADTIIKAHEKTLDQGANNDPEKLRREIEKLEQQNREKKAKIEAEAKAAENARKQQVAAEAKRKRELEREAARQALQQMEKTVEIDENSLFLNDFAILGSNHAENAPSIDLHGLGGFNLDRSKNPLEQLGLFRKDDDDDEEDYFVQTSISPNDVEEGEID